MKHLSLLALTLLVICPKIFATENPECKVWRQKWETLDGHQGEPKPEQLKTKDVFQLLQTYPGPIVRPEIQIASGEKAIDAYHRVETAPTCDEMAFFDAEKYLMNSKLSVKERHEFIRLVFDEIKKDSEANLGLIPLMTTRLVLETLSKQMWLELNEAEAFQLENLSTTTVHNLNEEKAHVESCDEPRMKCTDAQWSGKMNEMRFNESETRLLYSQFVFWTDHVQQRTPY
jgi:hypothetical protein